MPSPRPLLLTLSALLLLLTLRDNAPVSASTSLSFVHEDLLGHPHYQIVFRKDFIANGTLAEILKSDSHIVEPEHADESSVATTDPRPPEQGQDAATKTDKVVASPSHIIMRSGLGQRWLCRIPPAKSKSAEGADDKVDDEAAGIRKGVEKGLQLLDPLKNECLYFLAGWWTYEYCHLHYVRQFHQAPNAQGAVTIPARDDPNVISYYLGTFRDDLEELATLPAGALPPPSSDTVSRTDLQTSGEKRYLVQHWGSGTMCDITTRPRKVEVQFHCNMQSQERIALIKETSTCNYLVIVHTPRLCQDPVFSSKSRTEVSQIVCNPIVSDTYHEILMAQEQERQIEAAARDTETPPFSNPETDEVRDAPAETGDADDLERVTREMRREGEEVQDNTKVRMWLYEDGKVTEAGSKKHAEEAVAAAAAGEDGQEIDEETRRLLNEQSAKVEIQELLRELLAVQKKQGDAGEPETRKKTVGEIVIELMERGTVPQRAEQQQTKGTAARETFGSGQERISKAYEMVYDDEGEEGKEKGRDKTEL